MSNEEAATTSTKLPLINSKRPYARSASHPRDELQSFRTWLKGLCLYQSDPWSAVLSWLVFLTFAVVVPCLTHYLLKCSDYDALHDRTYDAVAEISLTAVAALSFLCLSGFVRKYGLRRFLFFDKLCDESEIVRNGYTKEFNRSMRVLFIFMLPCYTALTVYKIWWYISGWAHIPSLGSAAVSNTAACIVELCSWFYRTMVFFLVCILFRLICYLQILRLQDFAQAFRVNSEVNAVLTEHLRIRRHLTIISHRYRSFILWSLILITASLLASLLMTTRVTADVNIYNAGELAVCCIILLAGLMILLRSATRITHKAQSITALAAKWHVCATVDLLDHISDCNDFDDEEEGEHDDTRIVRSYACDSSVVSYEKRQALVAYLENNKAGITIYGFMLDRTSLHTIFGIELTLMLWLLGKTVGKLLK